MAANHYQFFTRWQVAGTPEEVTAVLEDPLELPRWWPSVYLKAERWGDTYHLLTRGWLPYTLRWSFRVTRSDPPHGFSLEAWGDLEGQGTWTLTPLADGRTLVDYDWKVMANKPILRWFSFIFKPFFAANHRWAMARGLTSLELELKRRRGLPTPAPPGPVRLWPF